MNIQEILPYILLYIISARVVIKIGKEHINNYPGINDNVDIYNNSMRFYYIVAVTPILNMWVALVLLFEEWIYGGDK